MDWLEEISLRDGQSIHAILTSKAIDDSATDPRLGRADRLKRIKEQIRRLRFPRLAETEDSIRAKIQELKLHPEIRMSVPPGLATMFPAPAPITSTDIPTRSQAARTASTCAPGVA